MKENSVFSRKIDRTYAVKDVTVYYYFSITSHTKMKVLGRQEKNCYNPFPQMVKTTRIF